MDDQVLVCELEDLGLEQVASGVGANAEAFGWVVVGVNVIEGDGGVSGMLDIVVGEAMAVRRRVDLHRLKCNTFKGGLARVSK